MINKNIYIGLGLLSIAALTSCNNEEFIDNGNSNSNLSTYTLSASAYTPEGNSNSRANVKEDGKTFFWNTGDELTIWNGQEGFTFKAVDSYNDSKMPLNKVEFTGEASLEDGKDVWGVYPKKEDATTDNIFVFNLPEIQEQTTATPAMQSRMFMYGQGKVSGTTISNMEFKHLTGIMQFSLTNKRTSPITIEYVRISANADVFPYKVIIDEAGKAVYNEDKNEIKLTLNQEVNVDATLNGYMTLLPTQKMTADTELGFYAKVNGDEEELEIRTGKLSEMYGTESILAKDKYNYTAGKRYGISKNILPVGEDLGYDITGANTYSVRLAKGLSTLLTDVSIATNLETKITLAENLNFEENVFQSCADFKGLLDGNNKTISNIKFTKTDNKVGMILTNNGTIQNIAFENVTIESTDASIVGIICAVNNNKISNCSINNANVTLNSTATGSDGGVVVGQNITKNGLIENVTVSNTILTITNGKTNLGIIAGKNGSWNPSTIKGCTVKDNVSITCTNITNTSGVGGLVGWNAQGVIVGCSAQTSISSKSSAKYGGIAGNSIANSVIEASYYYGMMNDIVSDGSKIGGLIADNAGKVNGCYFSGTLADTSGIGAIFGSNSGQSVSNCYYFKTNNAASGSGNVNGVVNVTDAAGLKAKLNDINNAISSTGFKFEVNESDDEPLILKSK